MPEDRAIVVESAAGSKLVFSRLVGHDEISAGFAFTVSLTSTDLDIAAEAMLDRPMAIEAESGDPKRWFHGVVTAFRLVKLEERLAHYEAELRPWLWRLGLTRDCRIFQHLTVVEIIEEIFAKYPDAKFDKRLQQTYSAREYCVQFDESDLDFVRRLMAHEGIFHFFEYAEDGHTLVLADAMARLKPAEGYETVPFHVEDAAGRRDRDHLSAWEVTSRLLPRAYAHTDYNFEKPSLSLLAQSEAEPVAGAFTGEIYRQPGAHVDLDRGDALAAIRREELQAPHVRVLASGNVRGLAAGATFTLDGFPREDQNVEHLVLRAEYRLTDPEHRAGTPVDGEEETYRVELLLAPTTLPYRPPRLTVRPVIRGLQTATVTGPAGEEIWTDRFGRVKVQFHWDRIGQRDENSSCWIRVSTPWGGAGWGQIAVPRIGQEVVVQFENGDPDRPFITGMLFNSANPPPDALPAAASRMGMRSNTTPGGGGANEVLMEDAAGRQMLTITAERDLTQTVKNDANISVGYEVGAPGSYSLNVHQDRIESVSNGDYNLGVDTGNRSTYVNTNDTLEVGADRTLAVGGERGTHVVGNDTVEVDADRSVKVGGTLASEAPHVTVNGTSDYKVESPDVTIIGSTTARIGTAAIEVSGSTIVVTGTQEITLAVGGSSVKLDASGVTIVGPLIKLN